MSTKVSREDAELLIESVIEFQSWKVGEAVESMLVEEALLLPQEVLTRVIDRYGTATEFTKPGQLLADLKSERQRLDALEQQSQRAKALPPDPNAQPDPSDGLVRFKRAMWQRQQGLYPKPATCAKGDGQCNKSHILPCNHPPGYKPQMCDCEQTAWDKPLSDIDWARIKTASPKPSSAATAAAVRNVAEAIAWR